MALRIPQDGSTKAASISNQNEIDSIAKTASQAETTAPDGTASTQETAEIEKQRAASKNLAMSRKSESHLQASSQQALLQNQLSVYTANNNTQTLGKSADAANGPLVSQQHAQQAEERQYVSNPNSYESIRNEIAGALGTNADDPAVDQTYAELVVKQNETAETQSLKDAQGIIDAARTYGRTIETPGFEGQKSFQEFIPGEWKENIGDTEVFYRSGFETIKGDEILKQTTYFNPRKLGETFGYVESVIKDGKETITKVDEHIKGTILLKPGDTRDVPPPQTTPAGKVPSSFDPHPDGRYGSAGKPSTGDSSSTNSSGAPRQSTDSGGGYQKFDSIGSNDAQYAGSASPAAGSNSGTSNAGASGADAAPAAASNESAGVHTEHKGGSDTSTNTEGQWEAGPSVQTYTPPTEVTVEPPPKEDTTGADETDSQAAPGDYADLGPAPEAQTLSRTREAGYSQGGSNRSSATITGGDEGYADRPGAPIDYGNPADEFATEAPQGDSTKPGADPTVTDPANPGEEEELAALNMDSIRTDMIGTLRDGVHQSDPFHQDPLAANRPKTSDAERPSSREDDLP